MAQIQIGDDFGRINVVFPQVGQHNSEDIIVAQSSLQQTPNSSLAGDKKSTSCPSLGIFNRIHNDANTLGEKRKSLSSQPVGLLAHEGVSFVVSHVNRDLVVYGPRRNANGS